MMRFSTPPRHSRRLCAIALRVGALALAGLLLAATLPAFLGFHVVTIVGGSMGDALPVGSVAVTQRVDAHEIRRDDVIVFARPGASLPTLHRVVGIDDTDAGRVATTRGDANDENDPEALILTSSGERVTYYVPWVGYLLVAAQSLAGRVVFGFVGAAIIIQAAAKRWGPGARHHRTAPA